jgi:hypothetical protein
VQHKDDESEYDVVEITETKSQISRSYSPAKKFEKYAIPTSTLNKKATVATDAIPDHVS